jgi:hypothetical protein
MLAAKVSQHMEGDEVEPITHPGYTTATKKRKRKELKDALDKTVGVGRFAVIDLPNDDEQFKLRLCVVRITKVYSNCIDFEWYTYTGYPTQSNPTYKCTWVKQVLAGQGQVVDTHWCPLSAIVLTFAALTKSKKIPNTGRKSPLKMLMRALQGEFGPLPQDDVASTPDSDYEGSSSTDEASSRIDVPVTRARGKRRCKGK